ncbi:MAG TPA: hypothetical protein VI540_07150 [Gaiellaceae bacterium]|nr:hypothetical protein [Gaiellaceae bacterium]
MATATEETTVTFSPGTEDEVTVPLDDEEAVKDGMRKIVSGDEDDLKMIEALRLDSDVTLKVEAAIAGKAFKIKRTGDETVATHVIACRVHTLYRETAGEL